MKLRIVDTGVHLTLLLESHNDALVGAQLWSYLSRPSKLGYPRVQSQHFPAYQDTDWRTGCIPPADSVRHKQRLGYISNIMVIPQLAMNSIMCSLISLSQLKNWAGTPYPTPG